MGKFQINVTSDCRGELARIGKIIYEPKLTNTFLFIESDKSPEEILKIEGVHEVHDMSTGMFSVDA